jgi:ornithine--oxo-acid transaminase
MGAAKLKQEVSGKMTVLSMEFAADSLPQPVVATSKTKTARSAFLMCAPRLYDVDYVINPWMAGNVHAASREVAAAQWEKLYAAVSRLADVSLVEPQVGSPDMVFTANAGLIHTPHDHNSNHTNWNHCEVAISSFQHPERQGEETHFRQWFVENGYKILDVPRETPFEGEGDALFAERGSRLWAGYGPRTSLASHQTLREAWKIDVFSLELVDPRFYHLDTCFAPLEGGYAMYYPGAFSKEGLRAIEAFYPPEKRIAVEESDAVRFACNAVNIGRTIILNKVGSGLAARLESAGFELVQVELGEFLRAGGAAKCLVMRLR